ncbi:glycosyltransferase family 4 protein [Aetokthonos hydrillicola Thurmond2011]|jgi:glycosyltransferase involved in cell wall biosynthesis|uniref:Glycosyltransferase family 4 protein n=1 Tax=Aetokthonos hydrillicola Thurmond2011 TaxID=2712845 RepID=A0AAP5I6Z4_9CYAN|nr:glycosyltransferase family 4 protein [Aetokthonos hydrillicola]MBO3459253.1 glycosyltransferase family 4 protein [Aetokthonos hydrillicola CCALA 1050]MBW4584913.1 glycosyltransferase family 4 protein [Aetokthonos hydrillicola CCALA 1050]MDR9894328.1 glycosyltransferase family 4 protein [Aetokthonos hydrillicola Thurmond2011]
MRILLLDYYYPLGEGGFQKQIRGLFKNLIENGHQVGCLTFCSPDKIDIFHRKLEESRLFSLGSFIIPYEEKSYSFITKVIFWFHLNPVKFLARQNSHLLEKFEITLNQICQNLQIDIIHCLDIKTSYLLPEKIDTPILIDVGDSMTQHKKRAVFYQMNNKKYFYAFLSIIDYLKTRIIEKNVLSIYSSYPFTTLSLVDATVLKNLCYSAEIYVVPTGTNLKKEKCLFLNKKNLIKKERILVFYGFLNQIWNIDALSFLINSILPIVRKQHSNFKLLVTGFYVNTINCFQHLDWVEIVENVTDIDTFISNATLICWPFRYGSGIKTKILESMALGKAIVTTAVGVEAFTEEQKRGILIANTAEGIAQHIIDLFEKPDKCLQLGEINYQVASEQFSWDKKAKDYLKIYQYTIDKSQHQQ